MALWNRNEQSCYSRKIRNSKNETRNKHQIQMLKNSKRRPEHLAISEDSGREDFRCFEFAVSGFEFVSDFVLRDSSFGKSQSRMQSRRLETMQ